LSSLSPPEFGSTRSSRPRRASAPSKSRGRPTARKGNSALRGRSRDPRASGRRTGSPATAPWSSRKIPFWRARTGRPPSRPRASSRFPPIARPWPSTTTWTLPKDPSNRAASSNG